MIRVLIVDDHAIVRRGLKDILADERDIEVSDAAESNTALRLVREQKWDLVILDLDLPGKSGLDLLNDLKGERPRLPVLILSVYPQEQFAVRTLKEGASGFMSKDAAPEELVKAIRKILRGEIYISEQTAELLHSRLNPKVETHPHEALSNREFQILCLIGAGKTVTAISRELSLSVPTVSTHRSRILEKMGMKTTAELMRYAIRNHLAP